MTTDGLAALQAKRGARSMPAPRHPAPKQRADASPEPKQGSESSQSQPAPSKKKPPTKAAPPKQPKKPADAPARGRSVGPSTIYFDEVTDEWLEEAAIAGRRGRPKIDSRSAFARLAVRKLMEELTPEQAVEMLRDQAASSATGGRPLH